MLLSSLSHVKKWKPKKVQKFALLKIRPIYQLFLHFCHRQALRCYNKARGNFLRDSNQQKNKKITPTTGETVGGEVSCPFSLFSHLIMPLQQLPYKYPCPSSCLQISCSDVQTRGGIRGAGGRAGGRLHPEFWL